MVILPKGCKPDNFELHNPVKISFRNIRGLCSNFVDCESFLESNCPDILALCETNLDDSVDCGNLSVWGYLPLIRKDFATHVWFRSLCEGRTSFYTGLISRKLQIFTCVFDWIYFTQCLASLSSMDHLLHLCARFLILLHLTQMRLSRSIHLLMCLQILTSIIRTG